MVMPADATYPGTCKLLLLAADKWGLWEGGCTSPHFGAGRSPISLKTCMAQIRKEKENERTHFVHKYLHSAFDIFRCALEPQSYKSPLKCTA
jgi:hypothetical protein